MQTNLFGSCFASVLGGNNCDGALAPGAPFDVWAPRNMGFLMQYFVVGVIYGGLPATVYGAFTAYLNVPGYVYLSAHTIIRMPWSFKLFFGMLNDLCPILGYRRKPYMVIGWMICFLMLLILSSQSLPEPFFCRDHATGEYIKKRYHNITREYIGMAEPCNPNAPQQGGLYVILMSGASLGYVIADVAADGMMVENGRREAQAQRGSTQTTIYLVRFIGSVLAYLLVGLLMNGKEYQGTFNWSLTFNDICAILAVPAGIMVPVSWFLVKEDKVADNMHGSLASYWNRCRDMLSGKAFFFVVLYLFFQPLIQGISAPGGTYIKKEWAKAQNLQTQIVSMISMLLMAFSLHVVKRHLLNYSWRKMIFATDMIMMALDGVVVYLTIFNVFRNQYFYLGENLLDDIPAAANFIVSTFIIVEMSSTGNEGLTYGLLTTITNLATPVARAIGNQVYGFFKPSLSDVVNSIDDSQHFRNVVALATTLSFGFAFASLTFLLLLPDQKVAAQERKATWPTNVKYAYFTMGFIACGLAYSVCVNILTLFPSTMCLKFAGGKGC